MSSEDDHSCRPVSDSSAPDAFEELILVGEIIRPHGLRGEMKIVVHSDVADRFAVGGELWATGRDGSRRTLEVRSFREIRGGGLIAFRSVTDRDGAEALRGALLKVKASEVPEPPEGYYYYYQLEGCRCRDREHGELGEVVSVVEDGGGVLLQVEAEGRSLLVPFVDAYLDSVDVQGRLIEVSLPPGFLEICVSRS